MQIVPAILPHTFEELQTNLSRSKGVASVVQIDLCDGIVGKEKTWLPNGQDVLPKEFSYEFDIMVKNWMVPLSQCLLLNPSSIIMHVDYFSDDDIQHLVKMITPYDVSLGIAVSNDKDVHAHMEIIHKIRKAYKNTFIQVMGIMHIGQQGQPFDSKVPIRIVFLKNEFKGIRIQVDGGVNKETIQLLKNAGADSVVTGSAIFGAPDVSVAYKELQALVA